MLHLNTLYGSMKLVRSESLRVVISFVLEHEVEDSDFGTSVHLLYGITLQRFQYFAMLVPGIFAPTPIPLG